MQSINNIYPSGAIRPTTRFHSNDPLPLAVYFAVFTVFSRGLTTTIINDVAFDYFSYPFFLFILARQFFFRDIHWKAISILVAILILSLSAVMLSGYPVDYYLKYFIPLAIIYFATLHVFKDYNIKSCFELYVDFAFFSSIIGLIQFFLKYFFKIKFLTDYSALAIDSVAEEPSHFGIILMPALIYAILNFRDYTTKAVIMLISMIMTFKISSYFIFALTIYIAYFKLTYLVVLVPFGFFIYQNYIITNQEFVFRLYPIYHYLTTGKVPSNIIFHGTPLSFISNLEVARYSLKKNLLLGVGIGEHEFAYHEYYKYHKFKGLDYLYGLNAKGGHSLLIRIISETGILGLILFVGTIIRTSFINSHFKVNRYIALSCFSHFLGKSIKLSSYIDYGTPFFFTILLLNYFDYTKLQTIQDSNAQKEVTDIE